MTQAEFAGRFGSPDATGALCGYTREADTQAVLTQLEYARPLSTTCVRGKRHSPGGRTSDSTAPAVLVRRTNGRDIIIF